MTYYTVKANVELWSFNGTNDLSDSVSRNLREKSDCRRCFRAKDPSKFIYDENDDEMRHH